MIIGKVQISGTCARTIYCKAIPKDIVGAKVAIEYDDALWDGLTKKVVFTNGTQTKERADPGALVSMPPEILDTVGAKVRIGVCGTSVDGELVIPTLWATLSVVQDAVPVEADEAAEPTSPIWAQLMGMIGNLDDLDTDARKNLVAAVNELVARGGEIDAAEVQQIVDAYLAAKVPEVKLPEALPNPHPLRLTGAVEATYDGSEAVKVVIPQGGGGLAGFEHIDTIDFSTEEMAQMNAGKEYFVDNVTEIVTVWHNMKNTTATPSTVTLSADNFWGYAARTAPSSAAGIYGYTYIKVLEGVGTMLVITNGANTGTNTALNTAQMPYTLFPKKVPFSKFRVHNPGSQYYANSGTIDIYVR